MKQLTCEMCGSTDLVKQDGVFVCQTCGTKYSVEEAKKMMIEGTVSVSGPVQTDSSHLVQNYLDMAQSAYQAGNYQEAEAYCNRIIEVDPNHYQAWMIKGKAAGWESSINNIRFSESVLSFSKAIAHAPEDEKDSLIQDAKNEIKKLSQALISLRAERFVKWPDGDEANGFLSDTTAILNAILQFVQQSAVRISPVEFTRSIARQIHQAVVQAYKTKIVPDYRGDDDTPTDYDFKTFLSRVDYCIDLLEKAVDLCDEDDEEDIRRYEDLIHLQTAAIQSRSIRIIYGQYVNTRHEHLYLSESAKMQRRGKITQYQAKLNAIKAKQAKKAAEEKAKRDREIARKNAEEQKRRAEDNAAKAAANAAFWENYPTQKQELEQELKQLQSKKRELKQANSGYLQIASIDQRIGKIEKVLTRDRRGTDNRLSSGEQTVLEEKDGFWEHLKQLEPHDAYYDRYPILKEKKDLLSREKQIKRSLAKLNTKAGNKAEIAELEKERRGLRLKLDEIAGIPPYTGNASADAKAFTQYDQKILDQQKQKKRRKTAILAGICAVLGAAVIFVILWFAVIIPGQNQQIYEDAVAAYDAGDYAQAAELFSSVITLNDSSAYLEKDEMKWFVAGSEVTLGNYQGQPITWIVLDHDAGKTLLVSRDSLEYLPYHVKEEDVTWSECSLRTWLNNTFLKQAFSPEELPCIALSDITTNDRWSDEEQVATQDNVFLLSEEEREQYFEEQQIPWECEGTDYAKAKQQEEGNYSAAKYVWYRDAGDEKAANTGGWESVEWLRYVRPAMWVDTAMILMPADERPVASLPPDQDSDGTQESAEPIESTQTPIETLPTEQPQQPSLETMIACFSAYGDSGSFEYFVDQKEGFRKLTGSEMRQILPGEWVCRYAHIAYDADGETSEFTIFGNGKVNDSMYWKVDGDYFVESTSASFDEYIELYEVRELQEGFYCFYKSSEETVNPGDPDKIIWKK